MVQMRPAHTSYNFCFCSLSSPFTCLDDKRLLCLWKSSQFPRRFNDLGRNKLVIKAVATIEPKCLTDNGHNSYKTAEINVNADPSTVPVKYSSANSTELDEKEKLRRTRISKANKGNTPWNKGRKHSVDTIQRIKERTRIAMQDPKVQFKLKMAKLGLAHSKETRMKIGVGVRTVLEERRRKQMVQEICYFEWQNLIAEVSRRGHVDEAELQWNSYEIISEELELEWVESVERRKKMPRPTGGRRAPKSLEQRRKIAEAIAAKWSDPAYRDRVYSGLAKYHGTSIGADRKSTRKLSGSVWSTKRGSIKKSTDNVNRPSWSDTTTPIQLPRLQRSKIPLYKDPLSNSKLEMIKNIRAKRAATETKKMEAIARARLLIAEAEKAAEALEVAATKSFTARASLVETRKLIAEAVKSIESIDAGRALSSENDSHSSLSLAELVNEVKMEDKVGNGDSIPAESIEANGTKSLASNEDLNFTNLTFHNILNGEKELLPTNSGVYVLRSFDLETLLEHSSSAKQHGQLEPNGNAQSDHSLLVNGSKSQYLKERTTSRSVTSTKKWVRGRLVEVTEEG